MLDMATETTSTVLLNGQVFKVLDEKDGTLLVSRPNGVRTYLARRLPDSPIYGENRGILLGSVSKS